MDQGTKEFTKVTLFLPIKEQVEDLNVTEDGFFRTDELKAEDLLNLLEDVSSRLEASRVLRRFIAVLSPNQTVLMKIPLLAQMLQSTPVIWMLVISNCL